MSTENLSPVKVNVPFILIFDRTVSYPKSALDTLTEVTSSDNGKVYDFSNPFRFEKSEKSRGVFNRHFKQVVEALVKNPYRKNDVMLLGSEKLPKDTKKLAGLLAPQIKLIQDIFPFAPDFFLTNTDDITIEVETLDGIIGTSTIEQKTDCELSFSNFVSVNGWVTPMEGTIPELNLTVVLKIAVSQGTDFQSVLDKISGALEKYAKKDYVVGILFNTKTMQESDYRFIRDSDGKLATHESIVGQSWSPPSKTSSKENLFVSLSGEGHGDLLYYL